MFASFFHLYFWLDKQSSKQNNIFYAFHHSFNEKPVQMSCCFGMNHERQSPRSHVDISEPSKVPSWNRKRSFESSVEKPPRVNSYFLRYSWATQESLQSLKLNYKTNCSWQCCQQPSKRSAPWCTMVVKLSCDYRTYTFFFWLCGNLVIFFFFSHHRRQRRTLKYLTGK